MKLGAMKASTVLLGVLVVCAASRATAQTLADVARAEQERRKTAGTASKAYTNEQLRVEPPPASAPMPAPPAAGAAPASAGSAADGTATPVAGGGTATKVAADGTAAKAAGPAATAAPAATALPATEDAWRAKVTGLRQGLARNQVLADALQSRIDALLTDFVNRDDPAQRAVVERNRRSALDELDRIRLDIKDAQKAVADLEEQARRAGVPPGWLR